MARPEVISVGAVLQMHLPKHVHDEVQRLVSGGKARRHFSTSSFAVCINAASEPFLLHFRKVLNYVNKTHLNPKMLASEIAHKHEHILLVR